MASSSQPKMIKRARAQVIGLIVEWEDADPLKDSSELIPGIRSHRNWSYRHKANEIYESHREWIYTKQQFFWEVTIHLVFVLPETNEKITEELKLTQRCKLDVINQVAEKQITATRMEFLTQHPSAAFKTSFFKVECKAN